MTIDEHVLTPDLWLDTMRRDYLRTDIAAGGSTVKVVVANDADRTSVREGLASSAAAAGFRYAHVDSAKRRVHLVHQFLWEVAARRFHGERWLPQYCVALSLTSISTRISMR